MEHKARLHKLCSQALREEDPRKLDALFSEIQSALSELIAEVREILREVTAVLKQKSLPRIH
jgi:signal transduction histidine kinase